MSLCQISFPGEVTLIGSIAGEMRAPRLRTLGEFAEDEIVIADGPYAGMRFRLDRHPVSTLLFREIDSGRWVRIFVLGPNQDGKSLLGFVIPTMYLLFERKETVILAVPSAELVKDKWTVDLLPMIQRSRYAELLPKTGAGSRDGESMLISFGNGARLRFMTGGGNDQARAGFTSRNLVVTETDGFDVVGAKSREGDKFSQLERRTLAFGENARILAECTVSTESGRTWQEYSQGTRSRIALPCPHCRAWVTPEREHLVGWQEAETERAAVDTAAIVCPTCGAVWSDQQRMEANRHGVLVHRGQDVRADGQLTGTPPETNTLGFRWTCVNSMNPRRVAAVGLAEWRARRAADEEVAERELCQSQWTLPAKSAKVDLSQLDAFAIMRRTLPKLAKGMCPEGTQCITVGCDVGKRLCHWTAIAWRQSATPHVIDYGRIEVPSDQMAEEDAILLALRDWRDETTAIGWKCGEAIMKPTFVLVDAGWHQETIILFAAESGAGVFATKSFGLGQRRAGNHKRETGSKVIATGDKYSLVQLANGAQYLEVDSDHWKIWLHARLRTPVNQPGALTLFDGGDHLSWCKHQMAEKQVEEFVPREGTVIRMEAVSRNNHYLDATALACVGGHAAGMRIIESAPAAPPPPRAPRQESDWLPDRDNWLNR